MIKKSTPMVVEIGEGIEMVVAVVATPEIGREGVLQRSSARVEFQQWRI